MRRVLILFMLSLSATTLSQQRGAPTIPRPPFGDGPFTFDTAEQHRIRVVVVTKGLSHPWGLAFLPDGSILVTERAGRLRLIKDGVLDPNPIPGVPKVFAQQLSGLMDIALHPRFSENKQVYLTYTKPLEKGVTTALARGRFDGRALLDVHDIFVADSVDDGRAAASRIVFAADGNLFMTVGGTFDQRAQDPNSHGAKVLRLRDDGTAPPDNPFAGRSGYKPEIFSLGHRNSLGLAIHPGSSLLWEHENGPNGGDELNIILPGRNYGWPVVSYGRQYGGARVSEHAWKEEMEEPLVVWLPSIGISGMTIYSGDRFPAWKGNAFVGSMRVGELNYTGHLQRIVFNAKFEELRRESLLTDHGALLRIEPAS
ncbi:MAG: PQQ-dependent sugar dehydrogenase [Acidobacteria bacterium]|nr:PQQ-dependent sugar dehydrogenase [Acidobacteriota bacterium]